MLKNASWLVTAGAVLAFAAPAFAADMPAKHHHVMSCNDYAWQSQQQKDCLDKKPPMAAEHKPVHKASHHKMKKPMGDKMEKDKMDKGDKDKGDMDKGK
jgi:hypothetical protein